MRFALLLPLLAALAACSPDYSPNTYSSTAVQQAGKVERGMVIGVRPVGVKDQGTVGAVTGAAAGGAAGSQTPGGFGSAIGAIGGSLVGGLVGASVDQAATATEAYEYIVQKPNGEMISVTQKDEQVIGIGTRVLVIAGNQQARIVPDYTVPDPTPTKPQEKMPAELPPLPAPGTASVP